MAAWPAPLGGRQESSGNAFSAFLARSDSLARGDPAWALPSLGDTPTAQDASQDNAFAAGLLRQLSFDPLRMDATAQPSGAGGPAPAPAPSMRTRHGGAHAYGEEGMAFGGPARALHAVRNPANFKPERGTGKARAPARARGAASSLSRYLGLAFGLADDAARRARRRRPAATCRSAR
jgi:hypothetical protein